MSTSDLDSPLLCGGCGDPYPCVNCLPCHLCGEDTPLARPRCEVCGGDPTQATQVCADCDGTRVTEEYDGPERAPYATHTVECKWCEGVGCVPAPFVDERHRAAATQRTQLAERETAYRAKPSYLARHDNAEGECFVVHGSTPGEALCEAYARYEEETGCDMYPTALLQIDPTEWHREY